MLGPSIESSIAFYPTVCVGVCVRYLFVFLPAGKYPHAYPYTYPFQSLMKKNGIGRENGSVWLTQERGLHPKILRNHRSPEPAICCANKRLFASELVV